MTYYSDYWRNFHTKRFSTKWERK